MAKILKAVDWYVHLTMIVSICLIIASFIVPPTGVIDGSVLAGTGELGGMAAIFTFLAKLPEYIEKGGTARVTKGGTTIEVGGKRSHGREAKPEEEPLDEFEQKED